MGRAVVLPNIGRNGTLSEQAYQILKKRIIDSTFLPGQLLTEEMLAEQLGISRTPIRAALKQLEHDGLVALRSGRGVEVARVSLRDVQEWFECRLALEPFAAKLAAIRRQPEQMARLGELIADQDRARQDGEYVRYVELDHDFHVALASLAGNSRLVEMIDRLNVQVQRFLILSQTLYQSSLAALSEHESIRAAVELGKPEAAASFMEQHIREVLSRISRGTILD
ncbi:hypothetical protein CVV65_10140 [Kyrpidia spormannii]|uniref:HTH gntR-type domain-containing protein n=2 Tax=Kyrpidia spormannii TaxID=2055160 RepID=A0A2K8N9E8_9BACL|nr:hypothetical protein CVV65_10140 [Kyrpidia spormannii]